MSAQEHDYELGTLDHEVLERDESIARHQQQRGDERRWMILGAAGTLALMTALVGAVVLGGNGEPRHLAASLGSPARDLAAVAAKAVTEQGEVEAAAEASKATRVARKADAPAPEAKKAIEPDPAAKKAIEPDPAAAIPASTNAAAASPTVQPKAQPEAPQPDESEDNAFSGLPSLPAINEAEAAEAPAAKSTDFAHDDNPFVDEDEQEDDEGDDEDEGEAPAPV